MEPTCICAKLVSTFYYMLNEVQIALTFYPRYIIRFKAWDKPDFHRSAEDIAFSVAMFFQTRGSLQNYYMVIDL